MPSAKGSIPLLNISICSLDIPLISGLGGGAEGKAPIPLIQAMKVAEGD